MKHDEAVSAYLNVACLAELYKTFLSIVIENQNRELYKKPPFDVGPNKRWVLPSLSALHPKE